MKNLISKLTIISSLLTSSVTIFSSYAGENREDPFTSVSPSHSSLFRSSVFDRCWSEASEFSYPYSMHEKNNCFHHYVRRGGMNVSQCLRAANDINTSYGDDSVIRDHCFYFFKKTISFSQCYKLAKEDSVSDNTFEYLCLDLFFSNRRKMSDKDCKKLATIRVSSSYGAQRILKKACLKRIAGQINSTKIENFSDTVDYHRNAVETTVDKHSDLYRDEEPLL